MTDNWKVTVFEPSKELLELTKRIIDQHNEIVKINGILLDRLLHPMGCGEIEKDDDADG